MHLICAELEQDELTINQSWQRFQEIKAFLSLAEKSAIALFIMEKEEIMIRTVPYYPPHCQD